MKAFCLLSVVALTTAMALAVPPYGETQYDYLDSLPITSFANNGDKYPEIESEGAPAVAWQRSSQNRTVKVRFVNPLNLAHPADVSTEPGWFIPNPLDPITWVPVTASPDPDTINFSPYGVADVEFTIRGLPDQVDAGYLSIPFAVESPYTSLYGSISTYVYLTLDTPSDTQDIAWLDVLSDSCNWARGATTADEVTYANTFGLYWNGVMVYTPEAKFFKYLQGVPLRCAFKIIKYFNTRYNEPPNLEGNCADNSAYLKICNDSQGLSSNPIRLDQVGGADFETHPICPAGSDASNWVYYSSTHWHFHQILAYDGLVYDAAASQFRDPNGQVYANPPAGWELADYWQTPVSLPYYGSSLFLGLTYRSWGSAVAEGEPVDIVVTPVNVLLNFTND